MILSALFILVLVYLMKRGILMDMSISIEQLNDLINAIATTSGIPGSINGVIVGGLITWVSNWSLSNKQFKHRLEIEKREEKIKIL